jgi:arsenate reductase (thioredoxin)
MANVLFVCVQNAGRSQIAEALFRRKAKGVHDSRSAGSEPAEHVHANVAAVMPELTRRVPCKLEHADAEWADVVVTMGCGDACPYIPGKRYVDWELDDPAGRSIDETRRIRDEIDNRVDHLLSQLQSGR